MTNINQLRRRVERLETSIALARQRQKAARASTDPLGEVLLARMSEKYVKMLKDDWARNDESTRQGLRLEFGALTFAFWNAIETHRELGSPLQLPDEIAAVYVKDPEADCNDDCEKCGYQLPAKRYPPDGQLASRSYFDRCPFCEGRVGRHLYSVRLSRESQYGSQK